MNLLREYIKELLTEAAKDITDLPEGVGIGIQVYGSGNRTASVFYVDLEGGYPAFLPDKSETYGGVEVERIPPDPYGTCGEAFMISGASAIKGWGPMVYDVAMEWATINGGGLMADREAVSGAARHVWDYYLNNRGDVTPNQLDNLANELTPDIEEDNCMQSTALRGRDPESGSPIHVDWTTSALSKRYTKAPTIINALRSAGKLVEL
jgi:hypothetical protein